MRTTYKQELERAVKEILRGIWKNKPTPLAKVCGKTSAHANALNLLQNEKKVEIYSKEIFVKDSECHLEYYRWVPYREINGGRLIAPLLIKKI